MNKQERQVSFRWHVTSSEEGMLLREYLREKKQLSKRALTDIKFSGGKLVVNGEEATVRRTLQAGDEVVVYFPVEKTSRAIVPEKLPLSIVYEDEYVLVINKQANMATIPSREHRQGTLAQAVLFYYEQKKWPATFHAINRLDKDTSGLLLVAKHRYSHDLFRICQQKGEINRRYLAIVHGHLPCDRDVIDAPIARKADSIIERIVSETGQEARTRYEVCERLLNETVVKVELETGRTHQIRVHFSYLGHPLLGDTLYGGNKANIERQALHSYELSFYHPFLKKELFFSCPLPDDIAHVIESRKEQSE